MLSSNSDSQRAIIARYISGDEPAFQPRDGEGDGEDDGDGIPMQTESLDDEEAACKLELQYVEQNFFSYSQSPFNIGALRFLTDKLPESESASYDVPLELETLVNYLPAASPSTKQFEYRARGYQGLIAGLRNIKCPSKALDLYRIDLIGVISVELGRLIAEVTQELKTQASAGTHYNDLRRIHFAAPQSERYFSPIVSAVVVLIAIVHCMMGVARDDCNLILRCLRCILKIAAKAQSTHAEVFSRSHIDPIPTTLPTALQYLGLLDGLDLHVVCPQCDTLYKEDVTKDIPLQCQNVNLNGVLCGATLCANQHRGNRTWSKPLRRFSHLTLESFLARFLMRPEIEALLEATYPLGQELCSDFWGTQYFSNFPPNCETKFFDAPAGELRLAFLVYHDFFNPYGNKIAGKKRSIGLIMMVCLNLPPDVRYDMKNIYVTAMLPGPKEPALENINNFLKPIVDNLCEHYDPGVYISKTSKYPNGRKVRSAALVSSMDIVASRAFSGLGSHSHTIFCSFCDATLSEIADLNLSHFCERSLSEYLAHVQEWKNASSQEERAKLWSQNGVRYSEWSRFHWWNPFTDTIVCPLHWIKNVLEKQIRENMGCSTTVHAGVPSMPPPLSRALTTVEVRWGVLGLMHLSEANFLKSGFPEPLLRFLCRDKYIFEAGLPSNQMLKDLNQWRKDHNIITMDGAATNPDPNNEVAAAKAEYYLSRAGKEVTSSLSNNSTVPALQALCERFHLPYKKEDKKSVLMKRLVNYYSKNVTVVAFPLPEPQEGEGPPLGLEVVAEIKNDMQNTIIPSWLKKPPLNFATTDHGKLASEEYKSIALVSLPVTLIRLRNSSENPLREYLDHFLHLSIAVRVYSYQSSTNRDVSLFIHHYGKYLNRLRQLYPYNSITPVQHLGLHIPYFMQKLGPSTRYSENTCEMFIGMLENMSTNSRIGELEQTLHRELIMAANLKATMDKWNFSEVLEPYADLIGDFLNTRYSGSGELSSKEWHTKHKNGSTTINKATYDALSLWAVANRTQPFSRHMHICEKLLRGHVVYQPFTDSLGNSGILFRPRGVFTAVPGRIEAILQEDADSNTATGQARIMVLARTFNELSANDAANDPYRNHPIVGTEGLNIMSLVYDSMDDSHVHIIEPQDIVSHIAVCRFVDSGRVFSADCAVIVDLDMKHFFDD